MNSAKATPRPAIVTMAPAFEAAMGAAFTVTIGLLEDLEAEGLEPAVVVALPLDPDPPDLPVAVADALVLLALLDALVVWFYIAEVSKIMTCATLYPIPATVLGKYELMRVY